MEIPTCIKYLEFVSTECDRYLRDNKVSDDELDRLTIEVNRFQEKVSDSLKLPHEIKKQIESLNFDYTTTQARKDILHILLSLLTFGYLSYYYNHKKQE